ncbi:MAG: hypothetical protein WC390_10205 [Sulfurimonas sp.]|jgi:hypothetical protein
MARNPKFHDDWIEEPDDFDCENWDGDEWWDDEEDLDEPFPNEDDDSDYYKYYEGYRDEDRDVPPMFP